METTKINISDSEIELSFTVPFPEIEDRFNKEINKQKSKIQIDGFRKGKVPESVIKRIYGNSIEMMAYENVAIDISSDYLKENNIFPIPETVRIKELDAKEDKTLTFKTQYEMPPVLEVKDYTGQTIEVAELKVQEAEVEAEYQKALGTMSTQEPADEITGNNHLVKVDLQKVDNDGNLVPGSVMPDVPVDLSKGNVVPSLVEALAGKKLNDEFEFSFKDSHTHKHPDTDEETIHEEEFKYRGTVKEISRIVPPELNEDLFQKLSYGTSKTEAEFKDFLRKYFESYYEELTNNFAINKIQSKVIENNDFVPPPIYVKRYLRSLYEDEIQNRKSKRQNANVNEEEFNKSNKARVENTIKWLLLKEMIIEKENLFVSDEEFQTGKAARLSQANNNYGDPVPDDSSLKTELENMKLWKYLRENNSLVMTEPGLNKSNDIKEEGSNA